MTTPVIKTVIYPVQDLAAAKAVFTALLGTEPVMDEPYYVQFHAGDQEIGLDPNGAAKGMTTAVAYWHVDDLAAATEALVKAGATVDQPAQDFGGRLVGTVQDADGNRLGLIQPASVGARG
jgi:predicted enzyme related to lactoylglutathione lyase